jgi:hypothetical protein
MLDAHVFRDASSTLGQCVYDLGQAYKYAGCIEVNRSLLFSLLTSQDDHVDVTRVSAGELEAARRFVSGIRDRLANVRSSAPDAQLVLDELRWAAEALEFACVLGGERVRVGFDAPLTQIAAERRLELSRVLGALLEAHSKNWLARSRPGGLRDSRRRLEDTLRLLVTP